MVLDSEDDFVVENSVRNFKNQNNKDYYLFISNKYIKHIDTSCNIFLHKDFKDKILEFPKFDIIKIIN
jgi:hypothetical protein